MIKAKHTTFFTWFFKHYSSFKLKHNFSDILIKGNPEISNQAVLLIGNHFSWWDGFIAKYINDTFFNRTFHVMMLENELKDRMFLSKAGAYSIMKNSRSMVESLAYTKKLLQNRKNLVTIYPQGRFYSLYHFPIEFEKGFLKQLLKEDIDFQIVFYVALVDYFEKPKPKLTLGLKRIETSYFTPEGLESEFNTFYKSLIMEQKQ